MSRECELYTDALLEHAAGRLPTSRATAVQEHLAGCAECRQDMAVLQRLRSAESPLPAGLDARVRRAALAEAGRLAAERTALRGAASPARARGVRPARWIPWALPAAAAAALTLVWSGIIAPDSGGVGRDGAAELAAAESYEPFGAWPAADGMVAGEPVLTDLSEEQLQSLLEDMES